MSRIRQTAVFACLHFKVYVGVFGVCLVCLAHQLAVVVVVVVVAVKKETP